MRGKRYNLVGCKFGRLNVVSRAPRGERKNRRAMWNCVCDCGAKVVVGADALKSGHTKSCGCFSVDTARSVHTKHGGASNGSVTPEYQAWVNMRARCAGGQPKSWRNYGGRGITVCEEWQDDFKAFLDHIGPRPDVGYEVDRIDNDDGYKPGNVRWATKAENNLNKRPRKDARGV